MLISSVAGLEVVTATTPLPELADTAGLRRIAEEPGGMWDGPVWARHPGVEPELHASGRVVLHGDACGYFELRARLAAGERVGAFASLVALTSDGLLVFTRRSQSVVGARGQWTCAGGEAADPVLDAAVSGPWDPRRSAARVAREELGCDLVADPVPVAVHLGEVSVEVLAAAVLDCTGTELEVLAHDAEDAWERDALYLADPGDVGSWPALGPVRHLACQVAVEHLTGGRGTGGGPLAAPVGPQR